MGRAPRPGPARPTGIRRDRVDELLDQCWAHRLTLVVAAAGCGKTTAIAQLVARSPVPVAWYHAGAGDDREAKLLTCIHDAATAAGIATGTAPWPTVLHAADALGAAGTPLLLVVDDLHVLRGTPAEAAFGRLVTSTPSTVSIVAASRTAPALDLVPMRLSGELLDVSQDDLRFRTWEVERLFRDHYGVVLAPEDLARLTRRVEGWAAGLQLFHLAAKGRPTREHRELIDRSSSRSRLARDYLARNVISRLDAPVRAFLLETSALGTFTAELADELRGSTDSTAILTELEAAELFTIRLDDAGTYRYHEVLRDHLELLAEERDGVDAIRRRFRHAGQLLAGAGFVTEALHAYSRGGDWPAVARLIGTDPRELGAAPWIDTVPRNVIDDDPWLTQAWAVAAHAAGRFRDAVDAYTRAEARFGDSDQGLACRRRRLDLQAWLDPLEAPPLGWTAVLRSGLRRDPLGAASKLDRSTDPEQWLGAAALHLAAGSVAGADELLRRVVCAPHAPASCLALARLGLAICARLGTIAPGDDGALLAAVEAVVDESGSGWLARLARSSLALAASGPLEDRRRRPSHAAAVAHRSIQSDARLIVSWCDHDGDPWGAALARLVEGLQLLSPAGAHRESARAFRDAARRFAALGAPVLQSLAAACRALALRAATAADAEPFDARLEPAVAEARGVLQSARAVGSPGAEALAALALHDPATEGPAHRAAIGLAAECGLDLDRFAAPRRPSGSTAVRPATSAGHRTASIAGDPGRAFAPGTRDAGTSDSATSEPTPFDPAPFHPAPFHPAPFDPPLPATADAAGAGHDVAAHDPAAGRRTAHAGDAPPRRAPGGPEAAEVQVCCFGTFELRLGGDLVDLSALRPRARSVLRLLAAHGGRPVHRELLADAFWPERPPEVGQRCLQVAISSIRQVARDRSGPLVRRIADAYVLGGAAGVPIDNDVERFAVAVDAARQARASRPTEVAVHAAEALGLYRGELLAEEGPATWVIGLRERAQRNAVALCRWWADAALSCGDVAAALAACGRGLDIDRFDDDLWRLLVLAHVAGGNHAQAAATEASYRAMVAELGLPAPVDLRSTGPAVSAVLAS